MRKNSFTGRGGLSMPAALSILILTGCDQASGLMLEAVQKQTTTFVLNNAISGFGADFSFDFFDGSLGTLTDVDIDVTGSNGQPQSFYFAKLRFDLFCGEGLPPCSGEILQGRIPWLIVPGMGALGSEILFDVKCKDVGNGSCEGTDTETGFLSLHGSDPNPADYVHPGTFNVELTTILGTSLLLPGLLNWFPDIWSGDITVTYVYVPKVLATSPEPDSLLLVVTALGLMAVGRALSRSAKASCIWAHFRQTPPGPNRVSQRKLIANNFFVRPSGGRVPEESGAVVPS